MTEQTRTLNEAFASAGSLGTIFDEPMDTGRLVTVSSNLHAERLPLSGSTAGEIRARFRQRFDIDPRSAAILDGQPVDEHTIVRPGQVLLFMREGGGKG